MLIADEHAETRSLLYFLPHRFDPFDLEESTPLAFEPHFNGLAFWSKNSPKLNPKLNLSNDDEDVKEHALNSCNCDGDIKEESMYDFSGSEDLYQLKVAALNDAPYGLSFWKRSDEDDLYGILY